MHYQYDLFYGYLLLVVSVVRFQPAFFFFFFNDTATTEIYTLSLHDALPISQLTPAQLWQRLEFAIVNVPTSSNPFDPDSIRLEDRKSTRLNSSHQIISYAVFCLKKKKMMTLTTSDPSITPPLQQPSSYRSTC